MERFLSYFSVVDTISISLVCIVFWTMLAPGNV